MAMVTSGPLLLAISANPVKVLKCFMKLNRSLCSLLLSGKLNFSWIWTNEKYSILIRSLIL